MKSLLRIATLGIIALTSVGIAQESKKEPAKVEIVKAMYMVQNIH